LGIPGYTVAVKTGTSEPYAAEDPICGGKIGETWAFGYSPDLVVGVWAGNADNSCLTNISSATLVFDAVNDVFNMAHAGREVTFFGQPENVVEAEVCVPSGMLKSDLCGMTTKDLFVKDDVPTEEDNWWRRVRIDVRNNQLASDRTPSRYAVERVMLVLPEDWLGNTPEAELTPEQKEQRDRVLEWAAALKITVAPTQESDGAGSSDGETGDPDAPAIIYSPQNGETVRGLLEISGRAAVDDFEEYRVDVGSGENPIEWANLISVPFEREIGVLAVWDTTNLTPGVYTIRLVVIDEDDQEYITTTTVSVDEDG
jgi:penicillin-binding protein